MAEQDEEKKRRWAEFIKFCEKLGFGEIEKVQVQNGIPISAESVTRKIKFN